MNFEQKIVKFDTFNSSKFCLTTCSNEEDRTEDFASMATKKSKTHKNNKKKLKKKIVQEKSGSNTFNLQKNFFTLFLVHKRKHSNDDINEQNSEKKNKKPLYKKHDKYEKDNILTKIQIHYKNFLISFANEIIKKIIWEESYNSKNLDKIIHLKEYLFNNIDHKFKSNIKKEIMKYIETIKIKDILSPSNDICKQYKIENRNIHVLKKIELMKNPILTKILNSKYLSFFNLYYEGKRNINIKEGNFNVNLELTQNIEFFDDLINKDINDKKYISKLRKFAISNFAKNNVVEKGEIIELI